MKLVAFALSQALYFAASSSASPIVQVFHTVQNTTFATCTGGASGRTTCDYNVTQDQTVTSQAQGPGASYAFLQSTGGTIDNQPEIKSSDLSLTDTILGTSNQTVVSDSLTMQVDFGKLDILGVSIPLVSVPEIIVHLADKGQVVQNGTGNNPGGAAEGQFFQSRGGYEREVDVANASTLFGGNVYGDDFGWTYGQPASTIPVELYSQIAFFYPAGLLMPQFSRDANANKAFVQIQLGVTEFSDLYGTTNYLGEGTTELGLWNGTFTSTTAITGIQAFSDTGVDITSALTFYDSDGNQLFTSSSSVPEPSNIGVVALGGLALMIFSRRRDRRRTHRNCTLSH